MPESVSPVLTRCLRHVTRSSGGMEAIAARHCRPVPVGTLTVVGELLGGVHHRRSAGFSFFMSSYPVPVASAITWRSTASVTSIVSYESGVPAVGISNPYFDGLVPMRTAAMNFGTKFSVSLGRSRHQ